MSNLLFRRSSCATEKRAADLVGSIGAGRQGELPVRNGRVDIYPFARIPPARNRRNSISVTNELLIQMLSNYP